MADYQAYIVGQDGNFISFEGMTCADDREATEVAERPVDGHDVEVWSGARFVARLKPVSIEVQDLDRRIEQSLRLSKETDDPTTSFRLATLTADLVQAKKQLQNRKISGKAAAN